MTMVVDCYSFCGPVFDDCIRKALVLDLVGTSQLAHVLAKLVGLLKFIARPHFILTGHQGYVNSCKFN